MTRIFFQILFLLVSAGVAHAQIVLPAVLEKPVNMALERNKEIRNKMMDLDAAGLDRDITKSMYLPRVEAMAGYAYTYNHIILDLPAVDLPVSGIGLFADKTKIDSRGNLFHGGLMAHSILYSGGQIPQGVKALEQKAKGDALLIESDKDSLVLEVLTGFDQLRLIEASEMLIEDSDRRLQKEAQRVERAIENGLAVPFDRDKIKLARLELETNRTELAEMKNLLFQKLIYLTGLSRRELEDIHYEPEPIVLEEKLDVDQKQELEALEAYRDAGKYLIEKEKGTLRPQAVAFAGTSYTGMFKGSTDFRFNNMPTGYGDLQLKLNQFSLAPNLTIGVGLKWQIYSGKERKRNIEKAAIQVRQLENKLEDSRDKLGLLLLQKQTAYKTQWKYMDLAVQQEVVAKNALETAGRQYSEGLISVTQRLEAENDFVKAGQKVTESLIRQRRKALEAFMVTGKLSQKIQYQ